MNNDENIVRLTEIINRGIKQHRETQKRLKKERAQLKLLRNKLVALLKREETKHEINHRA